MPTGRLHACLLSALISLISAALAACSRSSPTPESSPPPAATHLAVASEERPAPDARPRLEGPPGYVGSSQCQACHEKEYGSWHRSYHRTMTQLPSTAAVQADFNKVVLTNENARFQLSQTNDEFWVRMQSPDAAGAAEDSASAMAVRIGLVTGSHHMQVFWVPSGQGNAQIGFPFTWLIPERRWVPRKSTFLRPPEQPHLSEIWNITCSRCHTTAVQPGIDSVQHVADTRAAELGIACEACHGPGEKHVLARRAENVSTVASGVLAGEIVHPLKLDPIRASQICGFCHSMKFFEGDDWRQHGFAYRPGDDLEASTPIIHGRAITASERNTAFGRYLEKNPEILRDFFWPDGMIRVSGRDYNGLIESPCYKGGKFSCLSCHSLHKSEPAGQLSRTRSGNAACLQCHESFSAPGQLADHTHHASDSAGSECLNCHMPRTTYGVLKAIRSHQVSSPNVTQALATGRPDACSLCHLDKPLEWTARQLTSWYGHPFPELATNQTRVAESVRLALSGDAGQRALAAWHLGWQPALEASGGSWTVPVLAHLLDDPYAAVRCIAERSLRGLGDWVPGAYDYTVELPMRPSVHGSVIDRWWTGSSHETTRIFPGGGGVSQLDAFQRALDELWQTKNEHHVRLRE